MKSIVECYICSSHLSLNGSGYHDVSLPSEVRYVCDECYDMSHEYAEVSK